MFGVWMEASGFRICCFRVLYRSLAPYCVVFMPLGHKVFIMLLVFCGPRSSLKSDSEKSRALYGIATHPEPT